MRKRSLLVLVAFAWVGPVAAHGAVSAWHAPRSDCPAHRAKAEAAARQKSGMPAAKAVAAPVDLPGEGSVFGMGRSSVLMP
jgi:hypothetical protein